MSIQSPRIAETIRWVDDHVVKRIMRILLRVGVAPFAFALLETTGRRTGQRRLTPVGNGHIDDTFWLVAARGVRADYVKNLLADPDVRVKVGRQWYPGTAHVLPDDADAFTERGGRCSRPLAVGARFTGRPRRNLHHFEKE